MKQGILLAAFGSGTNQAEAAFRQFEALTRARFPGIPVRWAFTSMLMRERLASARVKSDSVRKALMRMRFERFTHVVVQPLHVIPGLEYNEICSDVEALRSEGVFVSLAVGVPLLSFPDHGIAPAARVLVSDLPLKRQPTEAVLFVGHGSRHTSTTLYADLANAVQALDPLVFIGTLSGTRSLETLLPALSSLHVTTVWVLPLLAVVGRHTLEDLAGASSDSWCSRLEAHGFVCKPVLKGMMEYPGILDLWAQRIAEVLPQPPSE